MAGHHEVYMQRCLQLAALGEGNVTPNPMVGAVLVYENRIIGEGYHAIYGEAHAEANCINSVKDEDKALISQSTLYVSLEPCAHYGKTPPCSDLIIRNKIPRVVIGVRDIFKQVDGKGIEKLKAAGIETITGILENESREINKRFFTFYQKLRPYIILKWAQTADKKISLTNNKRLIISNELSNRLVHKWRSQEAGIFIGTQTAITDNPSLTNRFWKGRNPVRIVIDRNLKLNSKLKMFTDVIAPTIMFINKNLNDDFKINSSLNDNAKRISSFPIINIMLSNSFSSYANTAPSNQPYLYQLQSEQNIIQQILKACYQLNIQSILVEGGAKLLQSFIDENIFDEIKIITNKSLVADEGLNAPVFSGCKKIAEFQLLNDQVEYFKNLSAIDL